MKYDGFRFTLQLFLRGLILFFLIFFIRCHPGEYGPGGPILVISDISKNPFSRYPVEILLAEGLNEFDVAEINDVSDWSISKYDVIVLGHIQLSSSHVTIFSKWVEKGGKLIALRPDALLQNLLGVKFSGQPPLTDKYILINNHGPGAGIVNESIQYHGEADLYSIAGATTLATIYSDAVTATSFPAVTMRNYGSGSAIAFMYDLARSIAYTRQGNPAWRGQKRDGMQGPSRSDDLFFGNAITDPQPDYVDFNKIDIPQADEQQRFLSNIIIKTNAARKPILRFWYLPKNLKAAIVMTGDDHNRYGTPARFEKYIKQGNNSPEDVANWNAIRATSYISPTNRMTDEQAAFYQQQGFEIALHLSTGCADWTPKSLDDEWVAQLGRFDEKYPELTAPVTNRTHCMCWSDWASQAKVQAQHGVRLDVNYYYWPGAWVKNRPGLFTGSAIPMRFADINGDIINCYQAPTQITDESDINIQTFTNQLLDKAIGKEGYYGAFVANMHNDIADHPGADIIVEAAVKRNIPVISAKQLLTWIEGRNNSSFGSITWNGRELSFYILAAPGSDNMKAMLPVTSQSGKLVSISKEGTQVSFSTEIIKGINYAFFDAVTGNYTATYKQDNTPPAIKQISVEPQQDGTAIIKWVTDVAADSRVDYGISGIQLLMLARDALPKYNHAIKLAGLFPGNTYHFRISSADEAGNVSIENPINESPLSFTMPGPLIVDEKKFSTNAARESGNNSHISEANDGQITLRPVFHQYFSGNLLSASMSKKIGENGDISFSDGMLRLDGTIVTTNSTFKPGSAIEFEAVFENEPKQEVGFISNAGFDSLSVVIGTDDSLKGIYARAGKRPAILLLYANEMGRPHKYRIEWKATRFVFFVDDIESATIESIVAGDMKVTITDPAVNKKTLNVDWIEVLPYAFSQAAYLSKIHDAGLAIKWDMISWLADTPQGTSVKVFYRCGNSSFPDKSWTGFYEVEQSGPIPGAKSRYLQYKVELSTNDLNLSPVFKGIKISAIR